MSIAHRLKPNEISQDALPFYDEFDGILRPLSEKDPGVLEIITCNHLPKAVRGLVHSAFDQTRSQESSSEGEDYPIVIQARSLLHNQGDAFLL
jgi:hypothetical protein